MRFAMPIGPNFIGFTTFVVLEDKRGRKITGAWSQFVYQVY
jgi:hypothetical protein